MHFFFQIDENMKKVTFGFSLVVLLLLNNYSCEKENEVFDWQPANNGFYDLPVGELAVDPATN